jgi:signal transduction histidine kinase
VRKIRSLRIRFVLAISALVALVLVANGLVLAVASRQQLRQDVERRAQSFAALAAGPICNAYETYYDSGYSKFRELLLEIRRLDPDLTHVAVYDTGGRRLFDSDEFRSELQEPAPPPAAPTADPAMLHAVKSMALAAWRGTDDGRPVYVVVAPFVEEWGRHRYSVAFYIVYDSLQAAAEAAGRRIFWLSAGSLALGVLIATLLAKQSVGPIEALTRGAQDFAAGRLARRIELPARDEFGVLASTFNQMAETLARTITDLETSNRRLGQMNLDLQQLDRMKTELLANVSHELRTPLTAIQGYADAMRDGILGSLNDPQRDALQVVLRNTRRLLRMIEQLLGFSRLEAGAVKLDLEHFDLREVAAHAVGGVFAGGGAGGVGGIAVRLDSPPDLPPAWGDAGRISQVIENLVTNAVRFSPPGAEVTVSLRRRGEAVEVAVADRGIGIPEEARSKIFERFYQVDGSSTRRYGGLGLGLAIVREILAAHGSDVEVESEVGAGTTFRFRLPAGAAATPATPANGAAEPAAAAGATVVAATAAEERA